ncbi:hypothetical protein ADN00_08565 [Ornatilinea apprima]|uniref:Cardiolipin synthase N-terminal domain-containing protein n=1 Tax=Ornatilinea apprima TaxID=1134406 RepID=A0A0N8GNB6_9CHLR|nr:hypothetical protein [Ornatilinea apprima]KPL77642.1 hypothetical protein ADN00_08565 [Ornatilinea apprima]
MQAADILRLLLVVFSFAMLFLSFFYLFRRKLTFWDYLGWGLVAVLIPILGPFLVIASRPGKSQ